MKCITHKCNCNQISWRINKNTAKRRQKDIRNAVNVFSTQIGRKTFIIFLFSIHFSNAKEIYMVTLELAKRLKIKAFFEVLLFF